MKELSELNLPVDLRYAESHEWAKSEGDKVKIGISDYAQDQLGDIVFVELPEIGDSLEKGEEFGTVESVGRIGTLYAGGRRNRSRKSRFGRFSRISQQQPLYGRLDD